MVTVAHDLDLLKKSIHTLCQRCVEGLLDVCKLELCVPDLSSVIAANSSLITEARQPPSPSPALSVSFALISPLSITFLPLINARGMCSRSQCVWMCVCECAAEIMDALSCVLCVSAAMPCVFCVCACQIGYALISHAVLSLN